MLGFDSSQEAKEAYLSNYEKDWQGFGTITEVDIDTFKEWLYDGAKQRKTFAEYADIAKKAETEKKPTEATPKEYGANNKGITTEQYEELKKRMKGLLNNLNVGFNPEMFTIGAQMAAYHMEAGTRKFAEYAAKMINDLGENVKPYLKSFYEGVRALGYEYEDMDSHEYVKTFDIDNFNSEQHNKQGEQEKQQKAEKAERYTSTNKSVDSYPQQAVIQGDKITVNNKSGRKTIGSLEISLQEWEKTFTSPTANPAYNKKKLIEQKHIEAFPGNLEDGYLTPLADRVVDAEISAIEEAYKKYEDAQVNNEQKSSEKQKDNVPLSEKGQPQQGSLFDNLNKNKNEQQDAGTNNRQPESDAGEISESEQVSEQGVSPKSPTGISESEWRKPEQPRRSDNSSGKPRTRSEHDVNRKYSNEEIHEIVSSVTEVRNGKVEITGEVADDIRIIASRYQSGGVAKEGRGILDEYYTNSKIVDAVGEILLNYIKPNTNIRALEPSVGTGNFIDALPTTKGEIVSFEINETTARIAKILHPNIEVNLRPFETEFVDEKGNKKPMPKSYDVIVGNPPYGQHRGKYKGLGEENRISRYEDYFVKRGLDVLNENGILAMVLPSGWMNRHKTENGFRILEAYRLPTGVFEGTEIGTDIVVLQKDSKHKPKENHNYFENNPGNILGEIKERQNRFGKMEEYVDGDIDSAMDALNQIEAKKIVSELGLKPTQDNINEIDKVVKESISSKGAKRVAKATKAKSSSKTESKGGSINITPNQLKYEFKKGDDVVPASNQFANEFSKEETAAFRDADYSGILKDHESHQKHANYYAGKWIHDFYYAEGNIYDRLEQLERDKSNISEEQYNKQKQILQNVLPKQKTINEVNINPNTAFVKNLTISSPDSVERASLQRMFLAFAKSLPRDTFGSSNYWEVVSYVQNEQVYGQDKARNQLIRERRKRVGKDLFDKFLNEALSDNQRKQIEHAFNREYNATYRPDYSKVPMFSNIHKYFRGKPFKLTEVQRSGIGRMTVKGVGVLAHEVGFGKTLSAILSMHEAMERGYTKKPLIVVPNDSILKQWVETINDILPKATVNVLGNLGVRYNLDGFQVNDNEYTIVTYQGFKKMSFENDVYAKLAGEFHYISDADLNKQKSEREEEKDKARIGETVGKMQRQTSYSFEEAGFDYLTFDEVHNANHIVGKVKVDRSDYSDFRSQSQNTSDLGIKTWVASQYIQQQNNGRNVLLLSATPFTNQPLEYYSILYYIIKSELLIFISKIFFHQTIKHHFSRTIKIWL